MMADPNQWQQAFVLNSKKYTDSRVILDIFTPDSGKSSVIARVTKKSPNSAFMPFHVIRLLLSGRGQMRFVADVEPGEDSLFTLKGDNLYCGMYLNELLQRLLGEHEASHELFMQYRESLSQLSAAQSVNERECVLRRFELRLLAHIGFGIPLDGRDTDGRAIEPDRFYQLQSDSGFVLSQQHERAFTGSCLLDLSRGCFDGDDNRRAAKRICRQLLRPHLGAKPLKSRELFS